jgi:hypothetical protein
LYQSRIRNTAVSYVLPSATYVVAWAPLGRFS